jgi:hypothetical protein
MLQYLPAFELPHGNAAFGERRLPEIAPLGRIEICVPSPPVTPRCGSPAVIHICPPLGALRFPPISHILPTHLERENYLYQSVKKKETVTRTQVD